MITGGNDAARLQAARYLGGRLERPIHWVDARRLAGRYIGETEKNLQGVLAAAQVGNVLLLIDEADALFGKRTEVKDSHDRYANTETNYLLQRMASYRGVVILSSNQRSNLDAAVQRWARFALCLGGGECP